MARKEKRPQDPALILANIRHHEHPSGWKGLTGPERKAKAERLFALRAKLRAV